MCQHLWTCRRADMCRHVPTCATTLSTSDTNHLKLILNAGMCQHIWTCWHVPTCDINHDTSYSDHFDLIWMLACVSICGHAGMCWYVPTCAGMCRHVTLISTLQIAIISTLSGCWHVSVSVDICRHVPICADMCRDVPTYDITLDSSDSDHLDFI